VAPGLGGVSRLAEPGYLARATMLRRT
jgi:hypothetical protein